MRPYDLFVNASSFAFTCQSSSRYVFDFEVYTVQPGVSNRPTVVVLSLAESLFNLGHIIYTDNYYTCPELSETLAGNNTHIWLGMYSAIAKVCQTVKHKYKKGTFDEREI